MRVGGSDDMLRDLVERFLKRVSETDGRNLEQRAAGDLASLARAAKYLKGSESVFASQPAYEAALPHPSKLGTQATFRSSTKHGRTCDDPSTGLFPLSTENSQEVVRHEKS